MTESTNKSALLGRRDVLRAAATGVLAIAGSGLFSRHVLATPETAARALSKLTGGVTAQEGKVFLKLPEIADNGDTVPITISIDSPMTEADYVKAVHVVAEGNPRPGVVTFNLSPSVGKAVISTRMRLHKTQNVAAAAVMSDGSVYFTKKMVKVTIGGCGG